MATTRPIKTAVSVTSRLLTGTVDTAGGGTFWAPADAQSVSRPKPTPHRNTTNTRIG